MRHVALRLWKDDCGALLTTEWVFLMTILVLGVVTGLVALRQAVLTEVEELANGLLSVNQSGSLSGQQAGTGPVAASTAGAAVIDRNDSISIRGTTAAPVQIDGRPCD